MSLLTQAAFGSIKDHLDAEKQKNVEACKKIDDLYAQLDEAHAEVAKFK